MTIPDWLLLQGADRTKFWTTVEFLRGRICEKRTIEWALGLEPGDGAERAALVHLLRESESVPKAWAAAWALVEESWSAPEPDANNDVMASYDISQRLARIPRSGGLIDRIADHVRPRLVLRPRVYLYDEPPRRIAAAHHLVNSSMTSTDMGNMGDIVSAVRQVDDAGFLVPLADALDGNIRHALGLAGRLGWDGHDRPWPCGSLHRVRFAGDEDPDNFHEGIAPTVKLLHVVILRLADLDPTAAGVFMDVWRLGRSSIDIRLWAELAHRPNLATIDDVEWFIDHRDDAQFWNVQSYPEVAALRAERFRDLPETARTSIINRIRRLPSRRLFHRTLGAETVERYRAAWAVREIQRIVVSGGRLPNSDLHWLEAILPTHPDLHDMPPEYGFPSGPVVHLVPSKPDPRFDDLHGDSRLEAIEIALAGERDYSPDFEGAQDWLGQRDRPAHLLQDLFAKPDAADSFPRALTFFFRYHRPHEDLDNGSDAPMVLALLSSVADNTIRRCIDVACEWMSRWAVYAIQAESWQKVWYRLWPVATEATNHAQRAADPGDHEARFVFDEEDPPEAHDMDTPVSGLVDVFFCACQHADGRNPFARGNELRGMREALMDTDGRAFLVVRLRLLTQLDYLHEADNAWSKQHLLKPLVNETDPALWRAVGQRQPSRGVLSKIGRAMAQQATNEEHPISTRESFMRSIVVDSLEALRNNRPPALTPVDVQQLLRSVHDDLRVAAARTICQYMRLIPQPSGPTPQVLFNDAVSPFLQNAWPLESHLAKPASSRWFSSLPARCGGEFVGAVATVERLLVPFAVNALSVYGLSGGKTPTTKLHEIVDDPAKAQALVCLLDLTIGASYVAPYDLSLALDRVKSLQPSLARDPSYQRLEAMTRR